ncbi:MAG TPA: TonB-dependent receptor, partial [Paludibacteraceae bacterium]|nr:TonB-dependent receptor [Paludibacteraceae bacterium]
RNRFIVNMGLTRSFFNDQLRIELKGQDLSYGMKDKNLLYNQKMQFLQTNRNDTREVKLTVRYNFNTAKSKYKGTEAGEKEMKRL